MNYETSEDVSLQSALLAPGRRFRVHPTVGRTLADPTIRIAGSLLVVVALLAVLAPVLGLKDPSAQDLYAVRIGPSATHWLGTDSLGRDTFSRVIYGARVSLLVGFVSVSVSLAIGVPFGLLSGFVGGFIDTVIMRFIDVVMAVPGILLAIAIITTMGNGVINAMLAIGFIFAPGYARLVRSEALAARSLDYVSASRSLGASPARLMLVHVFPATVPSLIVQSSLGIAFAILTEAGLSFLGLGVRPPTPSWGSMLQTGYPFVRTAPSLVLSPGAAIFVTVLAFNVFGDALRDVLDPRLRNRGGAR